MYCGRNSHIISLPANKLFLISKNFNLLINKSDSYPTVFFSMRKVYCFNSFPFSNRETCKSLMKNKRKNVFYFYKAEQLALWLNYLTC